MTRYFFVVELNVRNEQRYLKEFVAYYLVQGADHIYIYDNESDIPVNTILGPALSKYCTITPFPGRAIKFTAMQHWAKNFGAQCEWVAMIDCDELIQPLLPNTTIRQFLTAQAEDVGGIAINWVLFGDNQRRTPITTQELTIETFVARQAGINPHVKTIHRPRCVLPNFYRHPHCVPLRTGRYIDAAGNPHTGGPFNRTTWTESSKIMRVNHYWWRSEEEWKLKLNTIRDDTGKTRGGVLTPWITWMETDNCNAVVDTSCSDEWATKVRSFLLLNNEKETAAKQNK